MEEIKLPKFSSRKELEEFAKGLAQEIEALKSVIKIKDATIDEQIKANRGYLDMGAELMLTKKMLKDARDVNEELKKKCDNIDYKAKYEVYKSWLDKERVISAKLQKENEGLIARKFDLIRMCRELVDMMPFYKRKVANKLFRSII